MSMLLSSFSHDQHFDSTSNHIRAPLKTQLDGGNNNRNSNTDNNNDNDNSDTKRSGSSCKSDTGGVHHNHRQPQPRRHKQKQQHDNCGSNGDDNKHQTQLQTLDRHGSAQAQAPRQQFQQARLQQQQQQQQTALPPRHPAAAASVSTGPLGISNLRVGCSSTGSSITGISDTTNSSGGNSNHNSAACNRNQQLPSPSNNYHRYQPAAPAQGLAGPGSAGLESAYHPKQLPRQPAAGANISSSTNSSLSKHNNNNNQNNLPDCVTKNILTSKRPYLMEATDSPDQLIGRGRGGIGCEVANAGRVCVSSPQSQPMLPGNNIVAGTNGITTNESSRSNTTNVRASGQYYYEQTATTTTPTTEGCTFRGNPPPPHPSSHHHHHHHHRQQQQHSIVAAGGTPNVNARPGQDIFPGAAKAAGPFVNNRNNKMIKLSHHNHHHTNNHHQQIETNSSSNHHLQFIDASSESNGCSSNSISICDIDGTSSIGNIGEAGISSMSTVSRHHNNNNNNSNKYFHHSNLITSNHRQHHQHNKSYHSSNHTINNHRNHHHGRHHHARRLHHHQSSTKVISRASGNSSSNLPSKPLEFLRPDVPLSLLPPSPPPPLSLPQTLPLPAPPQAQALAAVAVSQPIPSPCLLPIQNQLAELCEYPILVNIEGHQIIGFHLNGNEAAVCLPHFMDALTKKFNATRVVDLFCELNVGYVRTTPSQTAGLIKIGEVPSRAQNCVLIKRSDADRLCMKLYENCYRGRRNNIVEIYRKQRKHEPSQVIIEQQLFGPCTDNKDQEDDACVTILSGPIPDKKNKRKKNERKTDEGGTTSTTAIIEIESSADEALLSSHPMKAKEEEEEEQLLQQQQQQQQKYTSTSGLVAASTSSTAAVSFASGANSEITKINVACAKSSTSTPMPTPPLTETRSNAYALDDDNDEENYGDDDDDDDSIGGSSGSGCLSPVSWEASESRSLNETNCVPALSLSQCRRIGVADSPKSSRVADEDNELVISHQLIQTAPRESETIVESPGSDKADKEACQTGGDRISSDPSPRLSQAAIMKTTTSESKAIATGTSPPTTKISAIRPANVDISACRNNDDELGDDSRVDEDVYVAVSGVGVDSDSSTGLARADDIDTEMMNANVAENKASMTGEVVGNCNTAASITKAISSRSNKDAQGTSMELQSFNSVAEIPVLDLARAVSSTLQIRVYHRSFGKCKGLFYPALFEDSILDCIECSTCHVMMSPRRFVGHSHGPTENNIPHWGFNSYDWPVYLKVAKEQPMNNLSSSELVYQLERLKEWAVHIDNGSTTKVELEDRYVFDPEETNLDDFFADPRYAAIARERGKGGTTKDRQIATAAALAAISEGRCTPSPIYQQQQFVEGDRNLSGSNVFDISGCGVGNNKSSSNNSAHTRVADSNLVSNNIDKNQNISHESTMCDIILQSATGDSGGGGSRSENRLQSPILHSEPQPHQRQHLSSSSPKSISPSSVEAVGCFHQSMASLAASFSKPWSSSSSTTTSATLAPAPMAPYSASAAFALCPSQATSSSSSAGNLLSELPRGTHHSPQDSNHPMVFLPKGFSDRPNSPPSWTPLPTGSSSSDGQQQLDLTGCRPGLPTNRMEPINFASLTPAEQQELLSTFIGISKDSSSSSLGPSTSIFIQSPLKKSPGLVEHQSSNLEIQPDSPLGVPTSPLPQILTILPSYLQPLQSEATTSSNIDDTKQKSSNIDDAAVKLIGELSEQLNFDGELKREMYICTNLASYLNTKGISSTMASDIVENTLIILRKSGILF